MAARSALRPIPVCTTRARPPTARATAARSTPIGQNTTTSGLMPVFEVNPAVYADSL